MPLGKLIAVPVVALVANAFAIDRVVGAPDQRTVANQASIDLVSARCPPFPVSGPVEVIELNDSRIGGEAASSLANVLLPAPPLAVDAGEHGLTTATAPEDSRHLFQNVGIEPRSGLKFTPQPLRVTFSNAVPGQLE